MIGMSGSSGSPSVPWQSMHSSTLSSISAARIGHAICYVADLASLRSAAFVVGYFACIYLFGLALAA